MTEEQFEELEQYEWDKFTRRYPHVTSKSLWGRLMFVFSHKGSTQRLVWENGYRHGWILGIKQYQKEQDSFE
jgi:hypothetical protein